jgi:hypothetical protein
LIEVIFGKCSLTTPSRVSVFEESRVRGETNVAKLGISRFIEMGLALITSSQI